jgi:hypothetical protein
MPVQSVIDKVGMSFVVNHQIEFTVIVKSQNGIVLKFNQPLKYLITNDDDKL